MTPIVLGYDPTTLRERIDGAAAEARLEQLGHLDTLAALHERVSLLRVVGRLDDALAAAREACGRSRHTGSPEGTLAACLRLAVVHQYRGETEVALSHLDDCVAEATAHGWDALAAFAHQHRGKVRFDRGEMAEAAADFAESLRLRSELGAPSDQLESSAFALRVARERLGVGGNRGDGNRRERGQR